MGEYATQWTENYFRLLLDYEYELGEVAAGAQQLAADQPGKPRTWPRRRMTRRSGADDETTADMALKVDPEFRVISEEKFRNDHEAFKGCVRAGLVKLTHRDMGPRSATSGRKSRRGPDLADPVPPYPPSDADVSRSRRRSSIAGLSIGQLVKTAWGRPRPIAAPTIAAAQRCTHPARAAKDWAVNEPEEMGRVLATDRRAARVDSMAERRSCWPAPRRSKSGEGCRSSNGRSVHRRARRCDAGMDRTSTALPSWNPRPTASAITSRPSIR